MLVKNLALVPYGTKATSRSGGLPQMTLVARAKLRLHHEDVASLMTGEFDGDLQPQGNLTAEVLRDDDDERIGEVLYPSDFADYKLNAEVMLRGTCHARGEPVASSLVTFGVGAWAKAVRVFGHRAWSDRKIGAVMSDPIPFSSMPIGYANSFGGEGYEPNPVGLGATGNQLPNVEDPRALIRSPSDRPANPAGLGPLNPEWPQRRLKRGRAYGADYQASRAPFYSKDFDWTHFHAAPADQQLEGYLRGDEEITYTNLHPELPTMRCRLPGLRLRAFYRREGDRIHELSMALDTLFVDADEEVVYLTWRGLADVGSDDLHDVKSLLIAMEEAAGSLPAKRYHERLEAFEADPLGLEEHGVAELERQRDEALAKLDDVAGKLEAIGSGSEEDLAEEIGAVLEAVDKDPDEVAEAKRGILELVEAKKEHRPEERDLAEAVREVRDKDTKPSGPPPLVMAQPGDPPPFPPQPEVVASVREALEKVEEADRRIEEATSRSDVELPEALQTPPRASDHVGALRDMLDSEMFQRLAGPDLVEPGPWRDLRRQDYRGWDLRGRDLSGSDLREAQLTGADLTGAKLTGAKLDHAVFYEAQLAEADLSGCSMTLTNLTGAICTGASLADAALETVLLEGARLENADLSRCRARRMIVQGAELAGAKLEQANLFECVFETTTLVRLNALGATLRSCAFLSCELEGAVFDDALLTRSSFARCRAPRTSFLGARGERVVFLEADLERADFSWAVLPDAFFNESQAKDARFFGANLKSANFYRSALDRASFERANLFRADLRKASLNEVSFVRTNLFEASLIGAAGRGTHFTDANLTRCRTPS